MTFARIRRFALSLPEVSEEPHHQALSWRVRGKIFVTIPAGAKYIHAFVAEDERERWLNVYPELVEKLMWGDKVAGIRIAVSREHVDLIQSIVESAWKNKAPRG